MSGQHTYRAGHALPVAVLLQRCARQQAEICQLRFSGELLLPVSRPQSRAGQREAVTVAAGVEATPDLSAPAASASATTRYTLRWSA